MEGLPADFRVRYSPPEVEVERIFRFFVVRLVSGAENALRVRRLDAAQAQVLHDDGLEVDERARAIGKDVAELDRYPRVVRPHAEEEAAPPADMHVEAGISGIGNRLGNPARHRFEIVPEEASPEFDEEVGKPWREICQRLDKRRQVYPLGQRG